MKGRLFGALVLALAACLSLLGVARAQGPDAGVTDAGAAASGNVGGCVESIPKGADRPQITDAFPSRGTSGWAATLAVTIRHGKGEHVLPAGLDLSAATEAKKYLSKAGFTIPDQDGGAAAQLWTEPDRKDFPFSVTHLELPLVVLPEKPGRSSMELPPIPVAVARSNGEVATVCTHPHIILVEDPIAGLLSRRRFDLGARVGLDEAALFGPTTHATECR